MSNTYIEKLAKEHDMSIKDVEVLWDKAKVLSGKAGHPKEYDYITGIFKKMMKESDEIISLVQFIDDETKRNRM